MDNNNNFPISSFFKPEKPDNGDFEKYLKSLEKTESNGESQSEQQDFDENAAIFDEILQFIKNYLNPQKFNTFFSNGLSIKSFDGEELVFVSKTSFIAKIVQSNYLELLNEAIRTTLGSEVPFKIEQGTVQAKEIKIDEGGISNFEDLGNNQASTQKPDKYEVTKAKSVNQTRFTINTPFSGQKRESENLISTKDDLINCVESKVADFYSENRDNDSLDPKKTFDSFIVGPSNNMAHASCLAVAEKPGLVYPSLYLFSGSGLGKTHLLHAVGNKILEHSPQLKIRLLSARDFMEDIVNAYRENTIAELRKKYTDYVDILMIDDIHELKGRERTQEEFFHIFNELYSKGKQLIFTSDKLPQEINGIEERIRTRLTWGLVIDIQQPDLETRIAILKHKAIIEDIHIPDDVVALIASSIKTNIRELEGSLIRLGAYSSFFNVDIDIDVAKEQLKLEELYQEKNITLEHIAKTAASFFKVPISDLKSRSRQKEITIARHIAMYLSYSIIKETLVEIGRFYGNRDHTSVLHAINKIKKDLRENPQLSSYALEIENSL